MKKENSLTVRLSIILTIHFTIKKILLQRSVKREKMSKQGHKFVFFIEPTDKDESATTIGNFYMNRIAIDEDASHEIVNIYAPKKYNIGATAENKEQIGMD